MNLFRFVFVFLFLLFTKSAFAVSFADTVLSYRGFKSQTDYNKVKLLNKEINEQLKRLNTDVLPYLNLASDLAKKNNFQDLFFDLYMNYGLYWKYDREYKLAFEYYNSAFNICKGDEYRQLKVYIAKAENYRASNSYDYGVDILKKAISIMDDKPEYNNLKSEAYNRMSAILLEIYYYPINPDSANILKKSKKYADSSLQIVNPNNLELTISNYSIIGSIFRQLGEFDKSIYYLNKAIGIMEKYPDSSFTMYNYGNVLLNLAGYYYEIKDYQNAEIYALKSIEYNTKKNIKIKDRFVYVVLSDIYEKIGDLDKAYLYEKKESEFLKNDKLNVQQRAMYELEAKYKNVSQSQKILQTEEIKNYQLIIIIAGVIMTVIIIVGFLSRHKVLKKAHRLLNAQNQELHELNATKDKFFSIIAHDLKNPIFSMRFLIDSLASELDDFQNEDMKYNFELLQKSSKNVGELLENLLTWSRSQRGIIQFDPMVLNTGTVIQNCLDIAYAQANSKNIELMDTSPNNLKIFGDVNMIITVIRNLISNAIKFTEPNGIVTINAVESEDKSLIEFAITDSGIGIPESKINTLFSIDKSYQRTGTNQELGTGLGLILCKEFVERNGGTIQVRSMEGKGSTFTFTVLKANTQNIDDELID